VRAFFRICLVALTAAGAAASFVAPSSLSAQGLDGLAARCLEEGGDRGTWCVEGLLALQSARGALGLAAAGGSPFPGTASSLGQRFPGSPRVAVAGGVGFTRMAFPAVWDGGTAPPGERTATVGGLRASAGVGILQGFSPAPTVGGVLSVDLLGSVAFLSLPAGAGFSGGVASYGYGVRVGLLRESFTLPGVSLSAVRHGAGRVTLLPQGVGPAAGQASPLRTLTFSPGGTSVRGVVGKDLFGLGLQAGAGWDRHGGELRVRLGDEVGAGFSEVGGRGAATTRSLLFAGATYTVLVLQVGGELGWARGYDALPGRGSAGYDPEGGSAFGTLSARITF